MLLRTEMPGRVNMMNLQIKLISLMNRSLDFRKKRKIITNDLFTNIEKFKLPFLL